MRMWQSAEGADWLSSDEVWLCTPFTLMSSEWETSLSGGGKMGGGPAVVGEVGVRLDKPSVRLSMLTSISE